MGAKTGRFTILSLSGGGYLGLYTASVLAALEETAVSRNNPQTGRFSGMNRIGPILKDCDIHFEVVNVDHLPANSSIGWMVRNEGSEAENTNGLGHFAGFGVEADERSAYRGTHYIDCVVKIGGRTVAMRCVPVTISGLAMPRRPPPPDPPTSACVAGSSDKRSGQSVNRGNFSLLPAALY